MGLERVYILWEAYVESRLISGATANHVLYYAQGNGAPLFARAQTVRSAENHATEAGLCRTAAAATRAGAHIRARRGANTKGAQCVNASSAAAEDTSGGNAGGKGYFAARLNVYGRALIKSSYADCSPLAALRSA